MHRIKLFILLVLLPYGLFAQEKNVWTLQECIDYALANNITIQRSRLDLTGAEINYNQARYDRLPNVNANGSYGFSWGRSIDPTTNLFVENQRIVSSNANASSSVTLFNGFNINNNIKQNELSYKATEKTVEDTENNVILNVVSFYTNVLFTKELFENSKKQLESTTQQVEITRKRVNAGALPNASLLDLLAQQATNELNKVNRENDFNNARIQLKQALQLPPAQTIDIVLPETETSINPVMELTAIEIYEMALDSQPIIQAAELNKRSAEYGVKTQQGTLYPTLSLNAGLSTQYSDAADGPRFVPDGGSPTIIQQEIGFVQGTNTPVLSDQEIPSGQLLSDYPFFDQYEDQLRKFISINVSIPIFNRFAARNNIQRSQISQNRAELNEKESKYQLWQTIEQSYNNVIAAAKSYESSQKQVEAREESFRVVKQRYEAGAANFVDFQVAENDLFQAKSDLLRAKYDFIFKQKILDFYQGKPLEF